jgi:hypothetical protein
MLTLERQDVSQEAFNALVHRCLRDDRTVRV